MGKKEDMLKGKKILIVDDEPDVLDTLEDLLSTCQVVKATSFEAAKRQLETQPFDMAVLDIMGVNGYELLGIAVQKKIPAVMLTAGENDARVHALHARKMAALLQASTASDPAEQPVLATILRARHPETDLGVEITPTTATTRLGSQAWTFPTRKAVRPQTWNCSGSGDR